MNSIYENSEIQEDIANGLYGLALEALQLAESNSPHKQPEGYYNLITDLGGEWEGEEKAWTFRDGSKVMDDDYEWYRSGFHWQQRRRRQEDAVKAAREVSKAHNDFSKPDAVVRRAFYSLIGAVKELPEDADFQAVVHELDKDDVLRYNNMLNEEYPNEKLLTDWRERTGNLVYGRKLKIRNAEYWRMSMWETCCNVPKAAKMYGANVVGVA